MKHLTLNQELNGPVNPSAADLAMENFRNEFKSTRVFVYENEMAYGAGDINEARRIVAEKKLPLLVIPMGKAFKVKYVPGVAACQFIMKQAS